MVTRFKELGSHAVVYGGSLIISKALAFILIPLYAKNLSTAEYGVIALLDFTVNIFALVIGCNINDALMKFYNDADELKVEQPVVITTGLLVTMVTAFAGCGALIAGAGRISELVFTGPQYAGYFVIVFGTMFFELVLNIPLQYMRILNKSKIYGAVNVGRTALSLLLNLLFILHYKFGVAGVLYTNLLANSLFTVLLLVWLRRETAIRFSRRVAVEMAKFSLPLVPAGIAATCLQSADLYVLKQLSTPSQVGIYSFGYKFGIILGVLVQTPFGLVWGPIAYRVVKEKDGADFIAKVMTYYNLVSVGVALGIALFIGEVIQRTSAPPYHPAACCVPLVLLGYVFFGAAGIFHLGILASKRTKVSMYITVATALLNISLNVVTIPLFDAGHQFMAPALATAVSFLVLASLRAYFSNKLVPIRYEYGRLAKLALAAAVTYATSTLIDTGDLYLNLMLKSMLLPGFLLLLLVVNFFNSRELLQVRVLMAARSLK